MRTAIVTAILFVSGTALAGGIMETASFDAIAQVISGIREDHSASDILLVFDLDNTLLAMNAPLGSAQWYSWQDSLIEAGSESPLKAADSSSELLDIQGLLFAAGTMRLTDPGIPAYLDGWQIDGMDCLVLTARGPEFNDATGKELTAAGLDFSRSAPDAPSLHGLFIPYDPDDVEESGITRDEAARFDLGTPREARYERGVLMVAGQHKGAMLLILLEQCERTYDAVLFVDDDQENIEEVYSALSGREDMDASAILYGGEDETVAGFDAEEKAAAAEQLDSLQTELEMIFGR